MAAQDEFGTFTGTGQSGVVQGKKVAIDLKLCRHGNSRYSVAA